MIGRHEGLRPIEILMVENNPGDVRLTIEILKGGRVHNRLHSVGDGEEALAYLRHQDPYGQAPRPDLILLDLNLPKKTGHEVLAEIKEDPDFRRIPVVALTASEAEADILKTYDLHVNCYIVKPVDLDSFMEVVRSIENFWLTVVTLPPK